MNSHRITHNSVAMKLVTTGALLLGVGGSWASATDASTIPKANLIPGCTVGFSDPTAGNTYLSAAEAGATSFLAKQGCKMVTLQAAYSTTNEISNIQTFITEKVNAIIIWPLDSQTDTTVLQQAATAGIKVIGFDAVPTSTAKHAPPAPYTGQFVDAHVNLGFINARFKYLSAHLPHGAGEVAYIGYGQPVAALEQDYALTMQVAKKYPKIKIVERVNNATDDISGAIAPASAALARYPKLAGFICYNDPSAIGAASAVRSAGRKGKVLVLGAELDAPGVAALKSGEIAVSWNFFPTTAGRDLGTLAWEAINSQSSASTTIVGPYAAYTHKTIGKLTKLQLKQLS